MDSMKLISIENEIKVYNKKADLFLQTVIGMEFFFTCLSLVKERYLFLFLDNIFVKFFPSHFVC